MQTSYVNLGYTVTQDPHGGWMWNCPEVDFDTFDPDAVERYLPLLEDTALDGLRAKLPGHAPPQGARPRASSRRSSGLRGDEWLKAYRALAYANYRGHVLNGFLTIAWSTVGITSDEGVARANKHLMDLYRHFARGCGDIQPYWVWVIERGSHLGLHTHALVHMPCHREYAFRNWIAKGLVTVAKRPLVMVPDAHKPDLRSYNMKVRAEHDVSAQWRRFRYMMKGLEPNCGVRNVNDPRSVRPLAEFAGLKLRDQGELTVPRVGVARALNTKAQKDHAAKTGARPPCRFQTDITRPSDLYGTVYLDQGRTDRLRRTFDV